MKNKIIFVFVLCTIFFGCKDDVDRMYITHVKENVYEGYQLVWSDDFLGNGLPSASSWGYEEGYRRNSELQDYQSDVSVVRLDSGKLVLRAYENPHVGTNLWTGEPYNFEYSSASVITRDKVTFERGRIDISAKVPMGRGLWPSIRLLPATDEFSGQYAAIDLMEYVWGEAAEHNTITVALHTSQTENGSQEMSGSIESTSLASQFHLYSLVWTKKNIQLLFDDKVVYTCQKESDADVDSWPFNQPFYLAVSLAVGGTKGGNWGIDKSVFPAEMEIDYVRYYKLVGDESDEKESEKDTFVPIEVIKNGGFESEFEEGKSPVVLRDYDAMHPSLMNHIGQWFVKGPTNGASLLPESDTYLKVEGSDVEGNRLVYSTVSLANWYTAWLRYPIQGVAAGKYRLSFYAKSNKEECPLAACITIIRNGELENMSAPDASDCIYIDEANTQSIIAYSATRKALYPVLVDETGTEWKYCFVDLEIPENQFVILHFNIYSTWNYDSKSYTFKGKTDIVKFYLDDVSLKTVDPSEE